MEAVACVRLADRPGSSYAAGPLCRCELQARTMSEDASFLRRWAQRKADAQRPAGAAGPDIEPVPEPLPAGASLPAAAASTTAVETPAPLPPIESLGPDSDYRPFLAQGVDRALRTQALRKLFHQPEYNVIDPLNDYIDDFTDFAPLGDVMTADLRHRLEVEAEAAAQRRLAGERPVTGAAAPATVAEAAPVAIVPAGIDPPPVGENVAAPSPDADVPPENAARA